MQTNLKQDELNQTNSAETNSTQTNSTQTNSTQTNSTQTNSTQTSSTQTNLTPTNLHFNNQPLWHLTIPLHRTSCLLSVSIEVMAGIMAAMADQAARLKEYYQHDVTIPRLKTGRKDVVTRKLLELLKVSHTCDERNIFNFEMVAPVGSTPQGLKVYRADEWDYNLMLRLEGALSWGKGSKGLNKAEQLKVESCNKRYVAIHLGDQDDRKKFKEFLNTRMNADWQTLQCSKMKSKFYQILNSALDMCSKKNDSTFDGIKLGGPLSPAIALTMEIETGGETDPLLAKADLAICISAALPFEGYTEWPRPETKAWLTADKIDEIKEMGINLVATASEFWRVSFAECETKLIKYISDIDYHEPKEIRKKVYRMLRCMLKRVEDGQESATYIDTLSPLSSYMLKNVWLWECEKQANPGDWAEDQLVQRCVGCVESLQKFVQDKNLPLYFCQDINLFAGKVSLLINTISRDATHLQKFLDDVLQGVRGGNRVYQFGFKEDLAPSLSTSWTNGTFGCEEGLAPSLLTSWTSGVSLGGSRSVYTEHPSEVSFVQLVDSSGANSSLNPNASVFIPQTPQNLM